MSFSQESIELLETPDFMKDVKFFTNYSVEILEYMFEAERYNILIKKRSDQLGIRPMLIELLQNFSKQQNYSQATLHLGKFSEFLLNCRRIIASV